MTEDEAKLSDLSKVQDKSGFKLFIRVGATAGQRYPETAMRGVQK